ncbi:hypothetical protein MFIFM68171_02549 [Madurella fahalii]|uniref:Uncharacterized protein n=1 Tax=Madurella fahalii TaxID=1157608 RepID=A0ABQ0G3P9_9PEZI
MMIDREIWLPLVPTLDPQQLQVAALVQEIQKFTQTKADEEKINELRSCYLHKESDRHNVAPRFQHRINNARVWEIPPQSRILDIGSARAKRSLILAQQNGPSSLGDDETGPGVTGIDTAPASYGGPYTLIEATSPNAGAVSSLFVELARARVGRAYLAEYTGIASNRDQLPHELAATAQSLLFRSRKPAHRIQDWNVLH